MPWRRVGATRNGSPFERISASASSAATCLCNCSGGAPSRTSARTASSPGRHQTRIGLAPVKHHAEQPARRDRVSAADLQRTLPDQRHPVSLSSPRPAWRGGPLSRQIAPSTPLQPVKRHRRAADHAVASALASCVQPPSVIHYGLPWASWPAPSWSKGVAVVTCPRSPCLEQERPPPPRRWPRGFPS